MLTIYKLYDYGTDGKLFDWIESFLSNRLQCVVVEHCLSARCSVVSGVPQGFVLGPFLFILYVNEVFEIVQGPVILKIFADDLKIYSCIQCNDDIVSIEQTLFRLEEWCLRWQMSINVLKSNVLHLGCRNVDTDYFINKTKLPDCVDLDVHVDKAQKTC
jgi:hypothetical protein